MNVECAIRDARVTCSKAPPPIVARWQLAMAAALIGALAGVPASASKDPGKGSPQLSACIKRSGGVTADMRACLADEYRRLDRDLNVTYKSVMQQLTPRQRTRLKESQRAWIWRRDYDCKARVKAKPYAGGTAGDLVYDDCRVQKVRARIAWLKKVPANPGYLKKV